MVENHLLSPKYTYMYTQTKEQNTKHTIISYCYVYYTKNTSLSWQVRITNWSIWDWKNVGSNHQGFIVRRFFFLSCSEIYYITCIPVTNKRTNIKSILNQIWKRRVRARWLGILLEIGKNIGKNKTNLGDTYIYSNRKHQCELHTVKYSGTLKTAFTVFVNAVCWEPQNRGTQQFNNRHSNITFELGK